MTKTSKNETEMLSLVLTPHAPARNELICVKMLYGKKNCEEAQIKVVDRYIGVVQSNTKTTLHAQFQQIKINSPIPLEMFLTFSMLEGTAVSIR